MAFARHQSFYLRHKWISKGLREINRDSRFFLQPDSPENIGLGKNMVQSLRFWMLATEMITEIKVDRQTRHVLTDLGRLIFARDRMLLKSDTSGILHYHLVKNTDDLATVFDWYFNIYQETVTDRDSLLKSFIAWVENNYTNKVSPRSLKRDIDCLVQLYTKKPDESDPEDITFSPFTKLNLMQERASEEKIERVVKTSPNVDDIGLTALYYVILKYSEEKELNLISLDEIINEKNLWGKVFNLQRNSIIEALNLLTHHEEYPLEYVRTNNLDNVRVPNITSFEFLASEYNLLEEEEAI